MSEQFLWTEKYRPKTINETILPLHLKKIFQNFIDTKNVPNLILTGNPGMGKTTVARAMLEELGCDYLVINGSMKGNIDTLRVDIQDFASTVSFKGGRKYVILDEAEYLNPNSTQPALRNFMEQFSKNCGFILTCNYKNRIIEALHSRCSTIDFTIEKPSRIAIAQQFFKRVIGILKTENIPHEPAVVAEVINKHFPDFRRVLNELQTYAATGAIDKEILNNLQESSVKELIELMNKKNYSAVRNWVMVNVDTDLNLLYRKFYDMSNTFFTSSSVPRLVLLIAQYQYQASFAADREINFMAFLTECLVELEFVE